jgi:CHASE3 domain sensor protein
MAKTRLTTLFAFVSLLVLSACGGSHITTAEADQYANLLEHEQRTLEQAKELQEMLNKTSEERLNELK